jgi:hypothetical protein
MRSRKRFEIGFVFDRIAVKNGGVKGKVLRMKATFLGFALVVLAASALGQAVQPPAGGGAGRSTQPPTGNNPGGAQYGQVSLNPAIAVNNQVQAGQGQVGRGGATYAGVNIAPRRSGLPAPIIIPLRRNP